MPRQCKYGTKDMHGSSSGAGSEAAHKWCTADGRELDGGEGSGPCRIQLYVMASRSLLSCNSAYEQCTAVTYLYKSWVEGEGSGPCLVHARHQHPYVTYGIVRVCAVHGEDEAVVKLCGRLDVHLDAARLHVADGLRFSTPFDRFMCYVYHATYSSTQTNHPVRSTGCFKNHMPNFQGGDVSIASKASIHAP